jgi:hypothetical protein
MPAPGVKPGGGVLSPAAAAGELVAAAGLVAVGDASSLADPPPQAWASIAAAAMAATPVVHPSTRQFRFATRHPPFDNQLVVDW